MAQSVTKQSFGIDVSKDDFQVYYSQRNSKFSFDPKSHKKFVSNAKGMQAFEAWIKSHLVKDVPMTMLMEATGVYYEELAYFLRERGYALSVLIPTRTHHFALSLNNGSKTDKIDARTLSQMAIERDLPVWQIPNAKFLTIKRLTRERNELSCERTVVINLLHAKKNSKNPEKSSLKRAEARKKLVDKQIKDIEKELRQIVKNDSELSKKIALITSIKGVGFLTAITLIGETLGFDLFKTKGQLVSFSGYDVVKDESGTSVKGAEKISKKGNSHIRRALYFPAISAVRHSPFFKTIFNTNFDKTKIKMKAYVAVQRKLLVVIYSMYKSNEVFNPNYVSVKSQITHKKIEQEPVLP